MTTARREAVHAGAGRSATHPLCSSSITNGAPPTLGSVIEKISTHGFEIADGIVGEILEGPLDERSFGVVELTRDPDCYRITLRLYDAKGKPRLDRSFG